MTLLEKITHYQRVWRIALPHLTEPAPEDVARWCTYPLGTVENAILRTGNRFAKSKLASGFNPEEAYRYTTAVARSMAERALLERDATEAA